MFWVYFKLFNNIKSEQEAEDFARFEIESLFGSVEPIYNFLDKLREEPLSIFTHPSIRIQDFITHELPYGRIQGYFGIASTPVVVPKLAERLSYTREIYLITKADSRKEDIIQDVFPKGEEGKNFVCFQKDGFLLLRAITNQYFLEKSQYISKLSRNEREVERNTEILFSHLNKDLYRIPASVTLNVGKRLQDYFAIREEPSLYLTHYFHPYKGKFHPKMARALLNYVHSGASGRVLDNFAGSGTLLVEASLMGIDSVGVEINPLSCLMCRVKCDSLRLKPFQLRQLVDEYMGMLEEEIGNWEHEKKGGLPFPGFKIDSRWVSETSQRINIKLKNTLRNKTSVVPQVLIARKLLDNIHDTVVKDFLLLALSGTISDIARRTREDFLEVFRKRLYDLYLRIFLFQELNKVLKIQTGKTEVYVADARDMKMIEESSIDGIVTSPPYAVALDYIKNDYPQLLLLELIESIEQIEDNLIGNPRLNLKRKEVVEEATNWREQLRNLSKTGWDIVAQLFSDGNPQAGLRTLKFFKDIYSALGEMRRVLRSGGKAAIVIGNNHFAVRGRIIEVPNAQVLAEMSESLGLAMDKIIDRKLHKTSEGIIREEAVVILRKEKL